MGVQLETAQQDSKKLTAAKKDLDIPNQEMKLDMAQAALDIAGIADLTPISDGLSGLMSLARGDYVGAALSLVSMVPYAGDALAKTSKGARLSAKITKLGKRILAKTARVKKLQAAAAEKAATAVQKARSSVAKSKIAAKRKKCVTCKIKTSPFCTRLPAYGKWTTKNGTQGIKGNSAWTPDPSTARAGEINKITKSKPIIYKDGYPDFSEYATQKVNIDMKGNYTSDFTNANKAAGLDRTPEGMTWHHNQNGSTMEPIPSELHNNVPHTGGNSIVNDKGY